MRNAFIQNKSWGSSGPSGVTQVHNTKIYGPGEISAVNESMAGNIISLYGDNIVLSDFKTTCWEGGRHTVLAGDHCRARDLNWVGGGGSTGNGGLRFQGGTDFIGERIHCESGDDVFQFVPAGAEADPTYGLEITDSVYKDCTGSSTHAKIVVIGLQFGGTQGAPDGVITMPASASVRRSGFINISAPDGTAVTARIQNISSAGVIEDCYLENVVTKGLRTTTGGVELLINAWEKTGGISGLKLTGVKMLPIRQALGMMRGAVNTTFEGCDFTRGSSATGDPVARISGNTTVLRNCTFDGANSTAPVVTIESPESGGGPDPLDVRFWKCTFENINGVGLEQKAGTEAKIRGCTFSGSGIAVKISGGSTPLYQNNNYGTLTKPA
jgi:hypothetical protein